MRLAEFIQANIEPILKEWEIFARSLLPGADMTVVALRDDAGSILRATARDMQNWQSLRQQASKSKGDGGADTVASDSLDSASDLHGAERVGSGFHITDVVAEYRALRASVLRLWRESLPQPDINDIDDITRFDESLDQSLARGVASYSRRIDDSRQMFLAILSHDLRNPLRAIDGFSQIIIEDYGDQLDKMAHSHLGRIRAASQKLSTLIDDLIELGRLTRAPISRVVVDLSAIARTIARELHAEAPEREARVSIGLHLMARVDPMLARVMLEHLLRNAWAFTATCTPAEIEFDARLRYREVVFHVRDNGAGFDMAHVSQLFRPFNRLHDQADNSGTGIGLATVQRIVHRHGGRIWAEGAPGKGASFYFTLPDPAV